MVYPAVTFRGGGDGFGREYSFGWLALSHTRLQLPSKILIAMYY